MTITIPPEIGLLTILALVALILGVIFTIKWRIEDNREDKEQLKNQLLSLRRFLKTTSFSTCDFCGATQEPQNDFCGNCGSRITPTQHKRQPKSKRKNSHDNTTTPTASH